MSKLKLIIEGGNVKPNQQFAQTLGPLGIMAKVLDDLNKKTVDMKGVKLPVEIEVNKDRSYNIIIGTPSVSELVKTELKLEKGAGHQKFEKIGNLAMQDIIKIAKIKKEGLYVNSFKAAIKSILGTCNQMGILVESKQPKEITKEIEMGIYDDLLKKGETEVNPEKRTELQLYLEQEQQKNKAELDKIKAAKEEKAAAATAITPAAGEEKKEAKTELKEVKKEEPKKEAKKEEKKK